MNTQEMHPDDALEEARRITAFLEDVAGAFYSVGDGCLPGERGWGGLLIITELLNDLLTRAGEEA